MKKSIILSESQLTTLIESAVRNIITEGYTPTMSLEEIRENLVGKQLKICHYRNVTNRYTGNPRTWDRGYQIGIIEDINFETEGFFRNQYLISVPNSTIVKAAKNDYFFSKRIEPLREWPIFPKAMEMLAKKGFAYDTILFDTLYSQGANFYFKIEQ